MCTDRCKGRMCIMNTSNHSWYRSCFCATSSSIDKQRLFLIRCKCLTWIIYSLHDCSCSCIVLIHIKSEHTIIWLIWAHNSMCLWQCIAFVPVEPLELFTVVPEEQRNCPLIRKDQRRRRILIMPLIFHERQKDMASSVSLLSGPVVSQGLFVWHGLHQYALTNTLIVVLYSSSS